MKTFQKATKRQSFLRLALVGPSGSGKTYTSLRVAHGLGTKIALLDSERGSAAKYADDFAFDTLALDTFSPREYIEGIEAAVAGGYEVLIIDSLSHAWMGKGGILEMHDMATAQDRAGNSYTSWRFVTPEHNKLVDAMLQAPLHIIATMRSKTEYIQEKNDSGKTVIRKVGLQPVQRQDLDFEFDVVGDMDQTNTLVVTKTRCRALTQAILHEPGEQDLAKILKNWLTDGSAPTLTKAQLDTLWTLAKSAGLDVSQLTAFINQTLGTTYETPRSMDSAEADRVIAALQAASAAETKQAG